MGNHFLSIGLPIERMEDMARVAEQISGLAEPVPGNRSGNYLHWRDPSGAEAWLQVTRKGEGVGFNPHFFGEGRVRANLTAEVNRTDDSPLDGALQAWCLSPGGPEESLSEQGNYPFLFDCPAIRSYANLHAEGEALLQVAAFAHELEVFESEAEFDARSSEGEPGFAAQSFVPSGLFAEGDQEPGSFAMFCGIVRKSETRTNTLTGVAFHWALVDSLEASFDVVVEAGMLDAAPPVGGVVQGSFYLSGLLLEYPTRKPGLLGRLLGKG